MEISIWAVVFLGIAVLAFVWAGISNWENKDDARLWAYATGYVSLFLVCCNVIYCNFDFGMDRSKEVEGIGWSAFFVAIGLALVIFVFAKGISGLFKK